MLSDGLWKEVRSQARSARQRSAAIAYVTQDHLGLKRNDILVTNASSHAISCGETDAKLLRNLFKRGVRVYNCRDLHAKVALFDNKALVGSGNMSRSSAGRLVEAAVITDHVSTVAGVASFIEQLVEQSALLTAAEISRLCKIRVIRRGNPALRGTRSTKIEKLGNQTWIIGLRELVRNPPADEQKMIDKAASELEIDEDNLEWVRWPARRRFARECREGDLVIQIWRSSRAKRPSVVFGPTAVLLKQTDKSWVRFYLEPVEDKYRKMRWGRFKQVLKKLAYPKRVGPTVTQLVDNEIADALARVWKQSAIQT